MAYVSTSALFRDLTDEEEAEFREHARTNPPPVGAHWSVLHPVCREEWEKLGYGPEADKDNVVYKGLRKADYQTALDAQSACNLSGIVYSFARIMERICVENKKPGQCGTDWKNEHAICRLFAEQIYHLTKGHADDSYGKAYSECCRIAAEGL